MLFQLSAAILLLVCVAAQEQEGCATYSVTHVYGSKGMSAVSGEGEEGCCQKGDTGRSGKAGATGPPGEKGDPGDPAPPAISRNYWTLSSTGCACPFNASRDDCACCVGNGTVGCQCDETNKDQCVPCGESDQCGVREIPRSCDFIDRDVSGTYLISPDPERLQPFYVFCDFSSGSGVTVVRHDSKKEKEAGNCEDQRCAVHRITYNTDLDKIAALTEVSSKCRQHIRYRCKGSVLFYNKQAYAAWVTRDGAEQYHWGGTTKVHSCACGEDGSCTEPDRLCNCDDNLTTQKLDEGFLSDKDKLPVTAVKFGDLGDFTEKGWYTVGFLECSGRA